MKDKVKHLLKLMIGRKRSMFFEAFWSVPYIILYILLHQGKFKVIFGDLFGILTKVQDYYAYIIPFNILIVSIIHFIQVKDVEVFIRRNIFSVLVIVPLFIAWGDIDFAFYLGLVHFFSTLLTLYDDKIFKSTVVKKKNVGVNLLQKIHFKSAQLVVITFGLFILLGAIALYLPFSTNSGKRIDFIDALFTSTSAVCVTGLSTISIGDNLSFVGQIILLLLVQVGGLGIMTLTSAFTLFMGKSLEVKQQVMMRDVLDISTFEELLGLVSDIMRFTFTIELIGAIILTFGFTNEGYDLSTALYLGFFHSINAFCNAGFSIFNNSFESFPSNSILQMTIAGLIILGGLGFVVLRELKLIILRKRKLIDLTCHTKVVLATNLFLLTIGTLYIFFGEFLNTLSAYNLWDKVVLSFFQSVTTRTAGFSSLPMGALGMHTVYIMIMLMFIGASPGSTGGGIKTSTFAVLVRTIFSTIKGEDVVTLFNRNIDTSTIVKSMALTFVSLLTVSFYLVVMIWFEPDKNFLSLFFEVVSAFGTVGLSLGITSSLTSFGKFAIVTLMFIGRVGPLTMILAIGDKSSTKATKTLPDGKIMIG